MHSDCLALAVYFGESDRVEGRLLSDELVDLFERHELQAAVLMRAVEGFEIKQKLQRDRLRARSAVATELGASSHEYYRAVA